MHKIGSLIKIKNVKSIVNLPKDIEYGLIVEYNFSCPQDCNIKTLIGDTMFLMKETDIEEVL